MSWSKVSRLIIADDVHAPHLLNNKDRQTLNDHCTDLRSSNTCAGGCTLPMATTGKLTRGARYARYWPRVWELTII